MEKEKLIRRIGSIMLVICLVATGIPVLAATTNAEYVFRYFTNRGYSPQAAAAVVGNLMWESGSGGSFNIPLHTTESNGEGIGMVQWSGGRKENFKNFCTSKGVSWQNSTIEMQCEFLEKELNGDYGNQWFFSPVYSSSVSQYKMSLSEFKSATDIALATGAFCFCFERPSESKSGISTRITYANRAYDTYSVDTGTSEPVDLGEDFYATILQRQAWIPLTCDDDKYVRLHDETGDSSQLWEFIRQDDGSYLILSAKTGNALEMHNGDRVAGNAVCANNPDWGGSYQRWYIYEQSNGYIFLSHHYKDEEWVLDLRHDQKTDGTDVIIYPRNNNDVQIFAIYKQDDNIRPTNFDVVPGDSTTETIFTWDNAYGAGQYDLKIWKNKVWDGDAYHVEWGAQSGYGIILPAGYYGAYVDSRNALYSKGSADFYFTVKNPVVKDLGEEFFAVMLHTDSWTPLTYDADDYVRLHTENGTASQVWLFQRQADGSYTIASTKDGDLLELREGNTANNTPLVVGGKDQGSDYQRWYIYGNYDTGYIIQSKYKPEIGRVITVQSEEPYDGVEIQTCERSNARTQFFTIYGASEVQMEAPTLSVTTGEGKADFQWTRTYGEAAYDLYIKKDGNAYQTERVQENVTSYTQELPAGTYSACVRAVNAFEQKESNTVSFTIEAVTKDISSSTIELAYTDTVYDGQTKTPKVTVTDGGTPLTEGTEYQVAYSNNQNAGTATVTVTGQGTYTGSVKKSFTIAKAEQALDVRIPKTAIEIDETVQITATTTSGGVIQYRSKDSEIAKVSDAGVITGVSSGQTTISVTAAETGNYLPASKDVTVTVKAVSAADEPTIRIGTVKGTAGQVVSVPISLENNPGIVSMLISVTYDRDVLTLVGVEDAGTFGSTNHNPSYSAFPYRLSWANDTAEKDFDMNGTIVTLKFQISEDAAEGVYPISIVEDDFTGLIFNKALETVPFVPKTGSVDVTKVLLGDVNGDGKVTPVDRACLARYLAGWAGYSADSLVLEAMDVNEDGKITAVDRAVLARHLAGWAGYEILPYVK